MNRAVVLAVAAVGLLGAVIAGSIDVRQEREFRRLIRAGDAALARDETSSAVEAFTGAVTLRRDSMLAWLKRGDTYRRRGDTAAAVRDLREASRLDPTAPRPAELLGDVYAAAGDTSNAAAQYRRYLALDDRAPRVLYKLALVDVRDGRIDTATDLLHRALALDDRLAEAHYLLGICLRERRQSSEARAAFMRAVTLRPGFVVAREALVEADLAIGRSREGIADETLATLEPERPARVVDIARAYAQAGQRDTALRILREAADRHPDVPDFQLALARFSLDAASGTPDPRTARTILDTLRQVSERTGSTPELLELRGRALYLAGDLRAAERVLEQTTRRTPVDPAALRALSEAAQRLGHEAVAREARARYDALAAAR